MSNTKSKAIPEHLKHIEGLEDFRAIDQDLVDFITLVQQVRETFGSMPLEKKQEIWTEAAAYTRVLVERGKTHDQDVALIAGLTAHIFVAACVLQSGSGEDLVLGLNVLMQGGVMPCPEMGTHNYRKETTQ